MNNLLVLIDMAYNTANRRQDIPWIGVALFNGYNNLPVSKIVRFDSNGATNRKIFDAWESGGIYSDLI